MDSRSINEVPSPSFISNALNMPGQYSLGLIHSLIEPGLCLMPNTRSLVKFVYNAINYVRVHLSLLLGATERQRSAKWTKKNNAKPTNATRQTTIRSKRYTCCYIQITTRYYKHLPVWVLFGIIFSKEVSWIHVDRSLADCQNILCYFSVLLVYATSG